MLRMTTSSVASAFVAAIFALHPLHIESVVWIAERKDLLCTFFFLLTIAAYVEFVRTPTGVRFAAVVVLFACALMSKPMAVTLPFVLLLLDYWPLRQFKMVDIRRLLMEKVPLFAMAAGSALVTFYAQSGGGAVVESIPFGLRIQNALVSYMIYVAKFVWPTKLAVFYPYVAIPAWQPIAAAAAIVGMTIVVFVRRHKRQSHWVGWLWFLLTLAPVAGFVQVGLQARADRYMYIPMIGLAIMLAWTFKALVRKQRWGGPPLALLTLIVLGAWAIEARRDVAYWRDSSTLFQRAIDVTQDNYVAYSNLAWAMRQKGQAHEAIPIFERALAIQPHFPGAESGLGDALSADKRFDEAMPHVMEAVKLEPQSALTHNNLGAAYSRRGQAKEAEHEYRAALALDPLDEVAHCGLGVALTEQKRLQEALPELQEAVRLNSDYGDGHYNLGRTLGLLGRDEDAIVEFREAIRVQPENAEAHYNLGTGLAARGRFSQALDEFKTAVEIEPEYVNARFGYASALANLENYREAVNQFEALLRLKPDFAPAQQSLALAIYLRDHPGAKPQDAPSVEPAANGVPEDRPKKKRSRKR